MANLIITIISIGLVAIAAIMGAYYGGTAFVQGQAKAYANTAVSQGDQISAAWSVYAAQNGGSYTNISSLSQLSVSPTYLASIPVAPGQVASSTAQSAWTVADLSATGSAPTSSGGVYFRLTDDQNGANTCNYVAQIAGGSSASPTPIGGSVSTDLLAGTYSLSTGAAATRKFDCVFVASVSTYSAAPSTSTTPKFIYYRTF